MISIQFQFIQVPGTSSKSKPIRFVQQAVAGYGGVDVQRVKNN